MRNIKYKINIEIEAKLYWWFSVVLKFKNIIRLYSIDGFTCFPKLIIGDITNYEEIIKYSKDSEYITDFGDFNLINKKVYKLEAIISNHLRLVNVNYQFTNSDIKLLNCAIQFINNIKKLYYNQ